MYGYKIYLKPRPSVKLLAMRLFADRAAFIRYLAVELPYSTVWSCGNNEDGRLGLGHCNRRLRFEMIESLPKLNLRGPASKKEGKAGETLANEKHLFKELISQQNKEMKTQIITSRATKQGSKDEIKEKMISGVIGMADWESKWIPIHEKNQQLSQSISQLKHTLNHKQQQLEKLQQEVTQMQKEVAAMEEEKETIEFFDEFLQPIAEAEKELRSGFEEKLKAGKHGEFTVDEASLFLNVCGMEELIGHQRDNQMDGEFLQDAISDISIMQVKNTSMKKKLKFFLKVLESGKMLNEKELEQAMVWRHREVEKTLLLLKEWDIVLDEELVRKKEISICQLIFFKFEDVVEVFGVEVKEGMEIGRKLQRMKKEFKTLLKSQRGE